MFAEGSGLGGFSCWADEEPVGNEFLLRQKPWFILIGNFLTIGIISKPDVGSRRNIECTYYWVQVVPPTARRFM